MGEAKRRAARGTIVAVQSPSSPAIEKVLGATEKGLVVSAPIEINGTTLNVKSSNLDPQDLRFSLLFWDKLAWPSSRSIFIEGGEDEKFLQSTGVLIRPELTYSGDGARGLAMTQIQAFNNLERADPGQWAFAQGETSFLLHDRVLVPGSGTALDIHRAIPVPDKDVPLAEILQFKARRQTELGALRSEIDALVAAVENSQDQVSELERQLKLLDAACANTLKVFSEWQFPVRLSSQKLSYDVKPIGMAAAAYGAFTAALHSGLPSTGALVAGLFGGAASSIKMSGDLVWRGLSPRPSPFRYVSQYHRELFGV